MTRSATTEEQRTPIRRKSTLFCWDCDHESPVEGDWDRRTTEQHLEYVCPVCETTIATRPLPDESTHERSTPPPAWQRTLRTTMAVWQANVSLGVSSVTAVAACQLPYAK
ncbi:hypothetical protein [Natronorubrum thiooxidans]|uniref:DUF8106 domain-containing protein n=1 Tax=Natronorubrum thiooxidans TaxID=308853 RepID=A0A1N7FN49_9EURY|nr:hypothetical protein [Natronorubrum thiooxidans]SIS01704.1 hypothetical protein SAMN05421752_107174 [Natronorubrum thiooxidans]